MFSTSLHVVSLTNWMQFAKTNSCKYVVAHGNSGIGLTMINVLLFLGKHLR